MDTKGHPGYTSFFSEYGDVAPGLEVDHLKISREETAKRGILMIAHHSSIWDTRACEQHPEWCVIQKDGTPDPNIMEPNSAYVDQKLIPQLKELAGKYGFDGAWLDGDTWGVKESFRPEIVEQFLKETGFPCLEDDCSSPSRQAFRQFWCDRYMAYMHHLIREVKADYPNFEITISFAFSTLMPMKPIPEMDFLSGDVAALSDMRAVSRGFVHQGKPWDVMSWAAPDFAPGPDGGNVGIAQKNLTRLCREASQVISQGGGYEIVNNMTTKGEIRMSDLPHMAPLSQFVLARKPWNYQSKPLENPALLHVCENVVQTVGQDWKSPNLYASIWEAYATCDPFLDGGRPVDVLFGYHVLEDQSGSRKTLILPETKYMTEPLKQKLLDFVRKGGNLIVIGPAPCQTLAEDVGITITSRGKDLIYLEENGYLYGYFDDVACFDKTGCEELIPCYSRYMDTSAPKKRRHPSPSSRTTPRQITPMTANTCTSTSQSSTSIRSSSSNKTNRNGLRFSKTQAVLILILAWKENGKTDGLNRRRRDGVLHQSVRPKESRTVRRCPAVREKQPLHHRTRGKAEDPTRRSRAENRAAHVRRHSAHHPC